MALAQIGFLTGTAEAAATAVAAGMVLGAFGAGAVGVLGGRSPTAIESNAVTCSYLGGIVAVVLACLDLTLRYL